MKTLITKKIVTSLAFTFVMLLFSAANATVFVNSAATGANNGTSWKNAYTSLQSALDFAGPNPGTVIWVASGVYKPSAIDPTPRSPNNGINNINGEKVSFIVPDQTTIIGGFAGTESSASQRKFTSLTGASDINDDANLEGGELLKNPSVLSGDLNGDDVMDRTNPNYYNLRSDNAYHVVTILNSTVTLDGLDVRGGYAAGTYYRQARGGGIYVNSGNVTLLNMKVEDNDAMATDYQGQGGLGGGLMATRAGAPPTVMNVSNSIFANNYADVFGGGAETIAAVSTFVAVTMRNNRSGSCGPAIKLDDGSLQMSFSIVKNNYSGDSCGGVFIYTYGGESAGGAPIYPSSIKGSIFRNNSGYDCGSILAYNDSGVQAPTLTISGNVFKNNQARTFDGLHPACGVVCLLSWDANVTANVFSGNSGFSSGAICVTLAFDPGSIGDYFATANITGNVFTGNSATTNDDRGAGAVKVELGQTANVSFNIFTGNSTPGNGGAIGVYGTIPVWDTIDMQLSPPSAYVSKATIKNNLFYSDVAQGLGNNIYGQGANLTVTGNAPNTYVSQ